MREIVLDTETTGLDPAQGHRLVEIGAVEIVNQIATGAVFHALINPERDVPEEAFRVHGHSTASLRDKPVFAAIVDDFLAFLGEDRLVIHNAEFDMRFLNAELARLGRRADRRRSGHRHARAGAAQASRRAQQSRRAVRPLSHRPFAPRQARRAARRGNPGRGLWRIDRRAPALAVLRGGRARRRGDRPGRRAAQGAPRAGAAAARRPTPSARAHRALVATLGEAAIWRRYAPAEEAKAKRLDVARRGAPVAAAMRCMIEARGSRSGRRRAAG